jgi:hypothetical protein
MLGLGKKTNLSMPKMDFVITENVFNSQVHEFTDVLTRKFVANTNLLAIHSSDLSHKLQHEFAYKGTEYLT